MPEMPPSVDFYAALGLDRAASPRNLVAELTRRIGQTPPGPARIPLEQARAVLGDLGKRRVYDARLNNPQAHPWTPDELHNLAMAPAPHQPSGIARFIGDGRQRTIILSVVAAALSVLLIVVVAFGGSDEEVASSVAAASSGAAKESSTSPTSSKFVPDSQSARGDSPTQMVVTTGTIDLSAALKPYGFVRTRAEPIPYFKRAKVTDEGTAVVDMQISDPGLFSYSGLINLEWRVTFAPTKDNTAVEIVKVEGFEQWQTDGRDKSDIDDSALVGGSARAGKTEYLAVREEDGEVRPLLTTRNVQFGAGNPLMLWQGLASDMSRLIYFGELQPYKK
ncbi:hypothetical protein [Gordonia alkaliphila]|uniref:J domain-containing protein n=1 Tax=Gordonia alkaliphila TaxID=1053547 RepID=A0ABP8Z4L5_9ACTN